MNKHNMYCIQWLGLLILCILSFSQCTVKKKEGQRVQASLHENKVVRNAAETYLYIQKTVDALSMGEGVVIAGDSIFARNILPEFYQNLSYQPAWLDSAYVNSVIAVLADVEKEGLLKEDYHYQALLEMKELLAKADKDYCFLLAQFDILMTDALLRYSHHLLNGKVQPKASTPTWNYSGRVLSATIVATLQKAIARRQVAEELENLKPHIPNYAALKESLAFYRHLAGKATFPSIPADSTLLIRTKRPAIALVRKRLFLEGLTQDTIGITPEGAHYYDDSLVVAVKQFQALHALQADGVMGKSTLQEMNVSIDDRIGQIKANLERLRWMAGNLTQDFIVVNIAGYELYMYQNNTLTWTTNVMTGAADTETPVFKSSINYLVFNPTWTVPKSIVKSTIIPAIRKDTAYLQKNFYDLEDIKGQQVHPDSIDRKKIRSWNFPYTVIQTPGEHNALGRVKFVFPNEHAIFLHDTPSKHLFAKSERAFSHGCIRVQNPLALAEILLADTLNWNTQKITEVVATEKTKTVYLKKRMDILLMYWTAGIDPGTGAVKFYRDIYKRDKQVLEALDKRDNSSLPVVPVTLPVFMVSAERF